MKLDRIKLINFKNFNDLEASFPSLVNVIVGTNGSGKTSFLEGIGVALGGFFGSQEGKLQRLIGYDEIKIEAGIRQPFAKVEADSETIGKTWSRSIKRDTRSNDSRHIRPLSEYGERFFNAFEDPKDRTPAPLLAYYSTQRLFKDSRLSKKQAYDSAIGRKNGYLLCLNEASIQSVLSEWLGKAATARATRQIKEIVGHDDYVLENVEKAIEAAMIQLEGEQLKGELKIYEDPNFDHELFVQVEQNKPLPLRYYSDGYRNILFLIMDMVWRASQLQPWLSLEELKEATTGVVMIDEIGLHLHPKWQAMAIPLITGLFPKVQFFIATHSPTVIANFEKGDLWILEAGELDTPSQKYFGREVNAVLRNILGANDRHIGTQRKLDELLRKLDQPSDSQQIEELIRDLVDQLGEEDPEVQRARSLWEWNRYQQANSDAIPS